MASNNKLLGSGVDYEALARRVPEKDALQKFAPAWRYHRDCPEGKVIKTDEALKELDAAGWVDHPGKIALLPGHESLFEEEEKEEDVDVASALTMLTSKSKRSKIDHSAKKDEK